LAVNFASVYPHMTSGVILCDPAGIMPTGGKYGAYWGFYFRTSILQRLLRWPGSLSRWIFYTWLDTNNGNDIDYYWFEVLADRSAIGDTMVALYLPMNYIDGESYWRQSSLTKLLALKCPVSFMYGEHDRIMPIHQAHVLLKILDAEVNCYIIPGAGHNPMNKPALFSKAVVQAASSKSLPGIIANSHSSQLTLEFMNEHKSQFSVSHTRDVISQFYQTLEDTSAQLALEERKEKRIFGRFVTVSSPTFYTSPDMSYIPI